MLIELLAGTSLFLQHDGVPAVPGMAEGPVSAYMLCLLQPLSYVEIPDQPEERQALARSILERCQPVRVDSFRRAMHLLSRDSMGDNQSHATSIRRLFDHFDRVIQQTIIDPDFPPSEAALEDD